LNDIVLYIHNWLSSIIQNSSAARFTTTIIVLILILIFVYVTDFIINKNLFRILKKIITKINLEWLTTLLDNHFFDKLSRIIPAVIFIILINNVKSDFLKNKALFYNISELYIVVMVIIALNVFLKSMNQVYEKRPGSKNRPIRHYIQVFQIILFSVGIIIGISIFIGKDIRYVAGGLGAFAAVLMLAFKDPIMGFVGGLQLSFNDMARPGDWVSIPSHDADGTVMEINLTTVKIQNWDKTITTVPTYSMVSDSFQNWRGMEDSGGRRIKRAISFDVTSIKFCDENLMGSLSKLNLIQDYIHQKELDIQNSNEGVLNTDILLNGRRQTNVGIFRAYVEAYLRSLEVLHKNMTFLVRQLHPSEKGLPIEIYVFSKVQAWAQYESIAADIMDHLYAAIPYFELVVYQYPTGQDFNKISNS